MRIGWPNDKLESPIHYTSEGPYWIFDLDGVLIDISPERYGLYCRRQYEEFNRAGLNAKPIREMVSLANFLHSSGQRIVVITGRDGKHLQQTVYQLEDMRLNYSLLFMRKNGETHRSNIEKQLAYESLNYHFKKLLPVCAIDDRLDNLKMFKDLSISTLLYPSLLTNQE